MRLTKHPHPDMASFYLISDCGKVWSQRLNRFMKLQTQNKGYNIIHLKGSNGAKHYSLVHRLVAELYCHKSEGCDVVNHLDNNPLNNHYTNLEWTTDSGNKQHASKQGRMTECQSKITEMIALELLGRANEPVSDLAEEYGVSTNIIRDLFRRHTWKHLFVGDLKDVNFQKINRAISKKQQNRGGWTGRKKKISDQDVEYIVQNKEALTRRELSDMFGVSISFIDKIFLGKVRCAITYKFGIIPKKWNKRTPFPDGIDTSKWQIR